MTKVVAKKQKLALANNASNKQPIYAYIPIQWSFCDTPVKGQVYPQMTPQTCRDSMTVYMMNGNSSSGKSLLQLKGRNTRLIAFSKLPSTSKKTPADVLTIVKAGVHIVNCVEKYFGWPLTKMHPIQTDRKGVTAYLISGSSRWAKAPVMIYLYVLLLRMGKSSNVAACKNYKELVEYWTTMNGNAFSVSSAKAWGHVGDVSYIKNCLYYLPILMSKFGTIFKGITQKEAWAKKHTSHNSGLAEITRVLPLLRNHVANNRAAPKCYAHREMCMRIYDLVEKSGHYDKKKK